MEQIDVDEILQEDKNLDQIIIHFTPKSNLYGKTGILEEGLGAKIGGNSKGELGNEKTPKVFFSKTLIGELGILNRCLLNLNHINKTHNQKGIEQVNEQFGTNLSFNQNINEQFDSILNNLAFLKLDLNGCLKE